MNAFGLLNPAGALALGAVGILIVLHLADRRSRVVPVGALFLWRQVPADPVGRRRLRTDPLFLLQLLVLLSLIAGYLRPYLMRPSRALVGTRLVLVLDVSASMQARETSGIRFDLARQRARTLVDGLGSTDEVMILAAAERVRVVVRWTTDHAGVRDRLEALEPLDTPTTLLPALALALGEARARPGTRIAVFTDLPPDGQGVSTDDLAAIDWVQIGHTDDNVAIASVTVSQPPFRAATAATATVVVRNYSHAARTVVLEARVNGDLWVRRALPLGPRASVPALLAAPPHGGELVVAVQTVDALGVDDRGYAWLDPGAPLDLALVTRAPDLGAAFEAVAGSRVEVIDPAGADAAHLGTRVALFDRVVPSTLPPGGVVVAAPPAGNDLCPSAGFVEDAAIVDWDGDDPAVAGLGSLSALGAGPASELVPTGWGSAVVVAAARQRAFPFLVTGERDGHRIACLGAELAPSLASSDRLPLLLLTLGALGWVAEPPGARPLAVRTGVPVVTAGGPPGAGLRGARDAPVVVAERTGIYHVGTQLLLANLFDDRESDIGRNGPREWAATVRPLVSSTRSARQELGWWLFALAAALLGIEWLLWQRGRTAARRRRIWLAAACRVAAAVALLVVLAGVTIVRPRPAAGSCIVAAIDVSASVQDGAIASARAFLAALGPALRRGDLVGSVAFAGRTQVLVHPAAEPSAFEALLPSADLDRSALEPDETDLAGMITRTAALCPESKQAALVVFTDGNETTGSLLAETALAEPRLPVYPVVPAPATLPRATIRRLLAPTLAPARTLVPLAAVVEARVPGSLGIALSVNGEMLLPALMDLPAGVTVVPLPYRFAEPGHYLIEATPLLPPPEPPAPGPALATLTVSPSRRILVVSEREDPVVASALTDRGMDVEVIPPAGLASRTGRLRGEQAVILDDVPASGIEPAVGETIARWVAGGGALVVTGGEHLFGDPGFLGGPIARLLPVAFESQAPEPREREPIALYLLIDRSNSMGYATTRPPFGAGEKMEYAKRAALAVLDQLGPGDLVGAIAFDAQPYELGPLLAASRGRAGLASRIRTLQYGGGTDFKDALDIALRNLLESSPRVRHVILLTDGDTNRRTDDHAGLIGAFAKTGISITTIRIGEDTANLELLDMMSRMTGGEFHHVENVHALPQLMIHDTQRLMDHAASRQEAPVHIADAGPMLAGVEESDLPSVPRWAITRLRRGGELRLFVERDGSRDPILATWQYELGRVAVVPLDFQADAAGWAAWRGFEKLWAQIVAWAAPPGGAGDFHLAVRRLPVGTLVQLETIDDDAGPFVLRLPALTDDTWLGQIGPRQFAAVLPPLGAGPHRAQVLIGPEAAPHDVTLMVPARTGSGRELRALGPDLPLLERVAALTGGRLTPEPATLLTARPGMTRERWPLATVLVPLALALILADIGIRRPLH